MMNFPNPSCRLRVASSEKNRTFVPETLTTGGWQLFLGGRPFLGGVPQAAAFDEAVEIFGQIGGVISGTL